MKTAKRGRQGKQGRQRNAMEEQHGQFSNHRTPMHWRPTLAGGGCRNLLVDGGHLDSGGWGFTHTTDALHVLTTKLQVNSPLFDHGMSRCKIRYMFPTWNLGVNSSLLPDASWQKRIIKTMQTRLCA